MLKDNIIYITVVLPVFNEDEDTIKKIYIRLIKVLTNLQKEYEVIFIDDGSTNEIFNVLKKINAADQHVKVIRFSKNFGQIAAFLAGFQYARGELIITMDSDLQNFPEDIPKFIEKINEGYDVVSGWRKNRKDKFLTRRLPSLLFNKLLVFKTSIKFHDWPCSFNAIRKDIIIKYLKVYKQNNFFLKTVIAALSRSPTEIEISHSYRKNSKSRYNLFSLIKLFFSYTLKNNNEPFLISEILT